MPQTFLITSATGSQGGATARELLLKGAKVHALVRDLSSPASQALKSLGVTLFKGDFFDIPAIKDALVGVTGIFLNTFPSFTEGTGEIQQAKNIVEAAKEVKTITSIVVSTVFKASERLEVPTFPFLKMYLTQKAGVEDVVKSAGFENWTVLRPDWLDYNYLAPASAIHFPEYQSEHVLTVSWKKGFKKAHLDPYDVGKFAAAALLEPERFHGRTLEISGELLTFDEVVERLSRVSGVEVKVRYRTEEETRELIEGGMMPLVEMQVWEVENRFAYDSKALGGFGIKLGSFEDYLEREKGRLVETLLG